MTDKRYSIRREFCGQPKMRWVVRFCGEWIGDRGNRETAAALARAHKEWRSACLIVEGLGPMFARKVS